MNTNFELVSEHWWSKWECAVKCCECGEIGDRMHLSWNYNEQDKCWEPMRRHWPKCEHFDPNRAESSEGAKV